MQLNISGHHVDVTDALRNYAAEKMQKLERHYDQITNAHIVLSVEKQRQRAEATIHVSGGDLFADADSEDLYAAIDMLVEKLDRQLIRHKEKALNRDQGRG
jgi:putative sigma-54 modulation protein